MTLSTNERFYIMPNWVYNDLGITGNKEDIAKLKNQMNQPFTRIHDQWDADTNTYSQKEVLFSNPVFAFWNIIKPTNMKAYNAVSNGTSMDNPDNWYSWNNRNWGTKWDVAVADNEKYPETELYDEGDESLSYRFNTAWGCPESAIANLSSQFPSLDFNLSFEEETGWGGEINFKDGESELISEYGWKCRECDNEEDGTPWCDECEFDVCPSCGYNESSEACDEHKEKVNA